MLWLYPMFPLHWLTGADDVTHLGYSTSDIALCEKTVPWLTRKLTIWEVLQQCPACLVRQDFLMEKGILCELSFDIVEAQKIFPELDWYCSVADHTGRML